MLEPNNDFVEGCFRLPGHFWEVTVFARADVTTPQRLPGNWDSGITGWVVHVPRDTRLDRDYVLRALSEAFGFQDWVQVEGPDSMLLR